MSATSERRREAAARVAALHRPLADIFAALRAERAAAPAEPESVSESASASELKGEPAAVSESELASEPASEPEREPASVSEPESASKLASASELGRELAPASAEPEPASEPVLVPGLASVPEPESELASKPELEWVSALPSEPEPGEDQASESEPQAETGAGLDNDVDSAEGLVAQVRETFAAVLDEVARDAEAPTPDDLALRLAMAAEVPLGRAAQAGAREARDAGVPGDAQAPGEADVAAAGLDVAPDALTGFAADPRPDRLDAVARRLVALARSAGMAAAAAEVPGWRLRQRFGEPYCPHPGCYGHDGRVVTPSTDGVPPYDERCNCRLEPVR